MFTVITFSRVYLNSRPPRWGVRKWQKFLATFNFPPISSSTDDWSLCFNVSIKTIFDILDDGGSIKVWLLDCFCKRCNLSFIRRALRSGYTAPPVAVAKVMASQIKHSHNNNRNNFNMTNGKLSLFRISLLLETKLKKLMIGSTQVHFSLFLVNYTKAQKGSKVTFILINKLLYN